MRSTSLMVDRYVTVNQIRPVELKYCSVKLVVFGGCLCREFSSCAKRHGIGSPFACPRLRIVRKYLVEHTFTHKYLVEHTFTHKYLVEHTFTHKYLVEHTFTQFKKYFSMLS
ncbi:hypothetical protein DPMN_096025 [Dreissena polymorpha]|uniref:Uncharacterized protein n=1 Tax=Dreissena polymorpha TaxID=45954 RepID=A0A9D4R525_DREPO|nr:hypothetical protein DPMN_096025 [Dreissena polymorpha]